MTYPLHFNYLTSPAQRERQQSVMGRLAPIHAAIETSIQHGRKVERIDISEGLAESIVMAFSTGIDYPTKLYGYPVEVNADQETDFVVISKEVR